MRRVNKAIVAILVAGNALLWFVLASEGRDRSFDFRPRPVDRPQLRR